LAKEIAKRLPPHFEHQRQWIINDCYLGIVDKLCSDWLQTSIYEIFAAITGKNNSDMLPAAS
jgi:hypothetical protein